MSVFVVVSSEVEASYVHGVYTTHEAAVLALADVMLDARRGGVEGEILEYALDAPPEAWGARWT